MDDAYKHEENHRRLIDEIARNAHDTAHWTGREAFSARTMAAMARVERHRFVKPEHEVAAYVNRPQTIGHGQTISQPYIVALMTDLLDLAGDEVVLEIGAGSGYQSAVLAEMLPDGEVHSVEIVAALADLARARLAGLGYGNVHVHHGDGYAGWPEEAPFDAIIVTAAPERIPRTLIDQLKPGGRMVVPVGRVHARQTLSVVSKNDAGKVKVDQRLPVAFVPMVHGRPEKLHS